MPVSSPWTIVGLVATLIYLLTWLLIPWVLLKRTVHPSASVAWVMAIVFIPILGALLCAVAGATRWERRRPQKQQASAKLDQQLNKSQLGFLPPEHVDRWSPLVRLTTGLTDEALTASNEVELLADTDRSAELIERIVKDAQHWIHLEFYIWHKDQLGTKLRDLLIAKARQGVEVRLLYDGLGSMWIGRSFLKPLHQAGVKTAPFTRRPKLSHLLTLNLRNHRKMVISDGTVAVTGGMNIGDEYVRPTKSYGHWRDTQILIRGPVVSQLQRVFSHDWYYATDEAITAPRYYPEPRSRGEVPAMVVADGPDDEVDVFYSVLVAALAMAKSRVTLATPYFVPPEGLAMGLETAARRGVQVRIMVAGRGNFGCILKAGRSYYQPLLRAGVEIYEYQEGIYHCKTMAVDGQWSLVGTPNCDFRSMILNFEVAVSLFDHRVAAELEEQFEHDLQSARRIEPEDWQRRSWATRLHEQFWRLFSPLF